MNKRPTGTTRQQSKAGPDHHSDLPGVLRGSRPKSVDRRIGVKIRKLRSIVSDEKYNGFLALKLWNEIPPEIRVAKLSDIEKRLFGTKEEKVDALKSLNPMLYQRLRGIGTYKKFEESQSSAVPSHGTPASEGFIRDTKGQTEHSKPDVNHAGFTELPAAPSRLWQPVRGRQKAGIAGERLVTFVREVYGPYLPKFKDELRDYIFRNDRKLYSAINYFESHSSLPEDIAMSTRDERVLSRLQHAAAQGGFEGMTVPEKRSVQGHLLRKNKRSP